MWARFSVDCDRGFTKCLHYPCVLRLLTSKRSFCPQIVIYRFHSNPLLHTKYYSVFLDTRKDAEEVIYPHLYFPTFIMYVVARSEKKRTCFSCSDHCLIIPFLSIPHFPVCILTPIVFDPGSYRQFTVILDMILRLLVISLVGSFSFHSSTLFLLFTFLALF